MSNPRTLLQLRTSVAIRGGYENSADITTTVLNDVINIGVAECYDIITTKWLDYYTMVSPTLLQLAEAFALPVDFYKLRKVEILTSGGTTYRKLYPHDLDVAHQYATPVSNKGYRYRIQGGALILVPAPVGAETLRCYYIPFAARLVNDVDTFDGINGYEELVIQIALRECKEREDLDTSAIERRIERLSQRVRVSADGRDSEAFSLDPHGPPDDLALAFDTTEDY